MGKTSSLTFRKQISWGITLAKCFSGWLGIQPKSLTVHSSYIGHPSLWTFCIPVILLFFCNSISILLCSFGSLKMIFQWKALALGNGRKKELVHPCPLASGCGSNNVEATCNSCSGCVVPALRVAKGGCHPWCTEFGSCSNLCSKTLSKALVLVEATLVSECS